MEFLQCMVMCFLIHAQSTNCKGFLLEISKRVPPNQRKFCVEQRAMNKWSKRFENHITLAIQIKSPTVSVLVLKYKIIPRVKHHRSNAFETQARTIPITFLTKTKSKTKHSNVTYRNNTDIEPLFQIQIWNLQKKNFHSNNASKCSMLSSYNEQKKRLKIVREMFIIRRYCLRFDAERYNQGCNTLPIITKFEQIKMWISFGDRGGMTDSIVKFLTGNHPWLRMQIKWNWTIHVSR